MANQDDYGDIPQEVLVEEDVAKDPERVAAGHKATIANPQTSEKAKAHSRQVLREIGEPYEAPKRGPDSQAAGQEAKDPANVARGLKASISNPGVSAAAKENAREKLRQEKF